MRHILLLLVSVGVSAQTITINPASKLQVIDGFGASFAENNDSFSNAQIDSIFSSSGLGLSRVRGSIEPDKADCESQYGVGQCVTNPTGGATIPINQLASIQRAVADGATFFAAEWSVPASMKTGGVFNGGGNMIGNPTNYAALAAIQTSYVTLMAAYGVPVSAIAFQNEPDQCSGNYPQTCWTGTPQILAYLPYLRSALNAAGYSSVGIMSADQSGWYPGIAQPGMVSAPSDISILTGHAYTGTASDMSLASFSNVTTQHLEMTEVDDGNSTYDGSISEALAYVGVPVFNYLTVAGVNAWDWWFAMWYTGGGSYCLMNPDGSGEIAKRGYALGNWAKFVRPGWSMVVVSNSTGLLVTGFVSADGKSLAIVAVNNSGSDVTNQSFSIGSFSSSTMTPWVTSSAYSLQSQAPVAISGSTFAYTIPANSVVTLVSATAQPGSTLNGAVTLSGGVQVN